jgi:hypothetical protein
MACITILSAAIRKDVAIAICYAACVARGKMSFRHFRRMRHHISELFSCLFLGMRPVHHVTPAMEFA